MKKILSVLIVLMSITMTSQHRPVISDNIKPYVKEYIKECKSRGYDVTSRINRMEAIVFSDKVKLPALGLASFSGRFVYISIYAQIDKVILRHVIFHELTHAVFLVGHCDTGCKEDNYMSAGTPDSYSMYYNKRKKKKYITKSLKWARENSGVKL